MPNVVHSLSIMLAVASFSDHDCDFGLIMIADGSNASQPLNIITLPDLLTK